MAENSALFIKTLADLRELAQKGPDADPKKFHTLARSLSWDIKSSFSLPMQAEQLDFIKILATSDASGEYWKGYGEALTDFLLPLNRFDPRKITSRPEEGEPSEKPVTPVKAVQPKKDLPLSTPQSVPTVFIMD